MIDHYRRTYMFNGSNVHRERIISIEEVLSTWNHNKERLFKIFGNKLILTKPFLYNKPEHEIERDIEEMKYRSNDSKYGERKPRLFYEKFIEFANEFSYKRQYEVRDRLYGLISSYGLKNNIYSGTTFLLEAPNGKTLVIERGCKATKALGKIAKAFDIPYFEDFRICHSQILNQKTIEGTLTLSIHPLDYMTMSDNDNGWSSCMSWISYGCYRQGTVEMMNSPNVVVAYLSDKNMTLPDSEKWNSKKWRTLIVADENLISHIKNYPYDNRDLSQFAVNWLKELTTAATGNTYYESQFYDGTANVKLPNMPIFDIITVAGYMYNDFNCSDIGHCIAFSSQLTQDNLETKFDKSNCLILEYSGPSMCMSCGATNINCDAEQNLVCSDCEHMYYCANCDDEISGEPYWVEDSPYCNYCYEEYTRGCYECETRIHEASAIHLSFVRRDSKEWEEQIKSEYMWLRRADLENDKIVCYQSDDEKIFCCESCLEDFIARECIPNTKIKRAYNTSSSQNFYFVYIDELTHSAKKHLFGGVTEEEYYNDLSNYGTLSIISNIYSS